MHDRREPSVERERAIRSDDLQPSAAPDGAVVVSTDESDEWLMSESQTYSDTDVSIRPRMHPYLSYRSELITPAAAGPAPHATRRPASDLITPAAAGPAPHASRRPASGPELPGYGDDPVAMRAHEAIDAAVAEFIGYSERSSLAPATPRRTPVGLPPQRALPEAPRPRRQTPVSSARAQPVVARHSTPPAAPPMRVTPLPSLPPLAARPRVTPSEPQQAPRRSTPPPPPPSAASGRYAPIAHVETTPHGILPRPTPVDTRPARHSAAPPPLPPSAATGRHAASKEPYGILPAYTQTHASRPSAPPPEPQVARRQTPADLTRTGRHPTPQPEPFTQAAAHATPATGIAGARRPAPAQAPPEAPAPRRNTPVPAPEPVRASVSPQQAAAETRPLPHASPRQTPSEPLPGAQGIPEQLHEQLLRALQRAHDSDVRSVAAERRAILAESAARAAAMSANVTQPVPRPEAPRWRLGRTLLWGAVCFSLGGYVALLIPIRERMLEQAEALRDLGQRQTQALEVQRQYYQGEHERLERQNAELERQLQTNAEAAKLTAAATTRR